jgi:hypothetical protein
MFAVLVVVYLMLASCAMYAVGRHVPGGVLRVSRWRPWQQYGSAWSDMCGLTSLAVLWVVAAGIGLAFVGVKWLVARGEPRR